MVVRAIHQHSKRAQQPFTPVNCGSFTETILESELFGHEKGAFTGAGGVHKGLVEASDGGTLFLDEITETTLSFQVKLLRVIQEQQVRRVGSSKYIPVNVRILAASNRDLAQLLKEAKFREDLYYRLSVVTISLPSLNERREDIPLLVGHFIRQFCQELGVKQKRTDLEALQYLMDYCWKGNVRELENLIQRLVVMTDAEIITAAHLPPHILNQQISFDPSRHNAPDKFVIPESGINLDSEVAGYEYELVRKALELAGGVKTKAAELLRLNKDRMKYLCKKYDL